MHHYNFEYWIDDMAFKGYVVQFPDTVVSAATKEDLRAKLLDVVYKQKKFSVKKIWSGWIVKEGWNREAFWVRDGWGGINTNSDGL